MPSHIPVFWILAALNGLLLTAYVYRRIRRRPPLPASLALPAQGLFVAGVCLMVFHEDVQRYVDWLTNSY